MNENRGILDGIESFIDELQCVPEQPGYAGTICGREEFVLLLGGVSACRSVPGIEEHMGYQALYTCRYAEQANTLRNHLERVYGIVDEATLDATCLKLYNVEGEYGCFQGFWDNKPGFDESVLKSVQRSVFMASMEYASLLRPYVGQHGFWAWDCNERIGLMRAAAACGILTSQAFWLRGIALAREAARRFASWQEYAVSCLCGAVYFHFRENGRKPGGQRGFFEINRSILHSLFFESPVWTRTQWYTFPEKQFVLDSDQMRPILKGREAQLGCMASNRIMVDGYPVGYMYREHPLEKLPDSGWRFLAGDESAEYLSDPDNIGIYPLNMLCNYDPDITPMLDAPRGTVFYRDEDGIFQEEQVL